MEQESSRRPFFRPIIGLIFLVELMNDAWETIKVIASRFNDKHHDKKEYEERIRKYVPGPVTSNDILFDVMKWLTAAELARAALTNRRLSIIIHRILCNKRHEAANDVRLNISDGGRFSFCRTGGGPSESVTAETLQRASRLVVPVIVHIKPSGNGKRWVSTLNRLKHLWLGGHVTLMIYGRRCWDTSRIQSIVHKIHEEKCFSLAQVLTLSNTSEPKHRYVPFIIADLWRWWDNRLVFITDAKQLRIEDIHQLIDWLEVPIKLPRRKSLILRNLPTCFIHHLCRRLVTAFHFDMSTEISYRLVLIDDKESLSSYMRDRIHNKRGQILKRSNVTELNILGNITYHSAFLISRYAKELDNKRPNYY